MRKPMQEGFIKLLNTLILLPVRPFLELTKHLVYISPKEH